VSFSAKAGRTVQTLTLSGVTGGSFAVRAADASGKLITRSPIEVGAAQARATQLRLALESVYGPHASGTGCRYYGVTVAEDRLATHGELRFEVMLRCTPTTDGSGSVVQFPLIEVDTTRLQANGNALLHDMAQKSTLLTNPGFEDAVERAELGYAETLPEGWAGVGKTYVVANGNAAWGGLDSGSGGSYLAIQNVGGE
jgi:hypothetical protein